MLDNASKSPPRNGLLLLGAAAVAGLTAVRPLASYDVFWYLRSGEEILARHALPATDPFSYTSTQPWLNHEWLAEILLALAHRAGGFALLGILVGLSITACVLIASLAGARKSPALLALGFALAAAAIGPNAEPRALILTWPLVAGAVAIALRDADKSSWRLAWLLPLQLLLTNLHGGDPLILGVAGLSFVAGAIGPWSWAAQKRRAVVGLGVLVLTAAGPYGLGVHAQFLGNHASLPEIREWHTLGEVIIDGSFPHMLFLVLAAITGVALYRRPAAARAPLQLLLFAVFTLMAAKYVRFCAEAAFVYVALLASQPAPVAIRNWRRASVTLAAGVAALALSVSSSRQMGVGLAEGRFPEGAAAWLRTHPVAGPMFNSFNYGGYLLWAVPEQKVFIDSRVHQVYADSHFRSLLRAYESPTAWAQLDTRWGFKLAVLQRAGRGASLAEAMVADPAWHVMYADSASLVLARN